MSKLHDLIREINNSGYQDGEFGAGHPMSIEDWKRDFKKIVFDEFKAANYDQFEFVDRIDKL